LESGISLDQSLKITAEQSTNRKFKEALFNIYDGVRKGQHLHEALSRHKKYFSDFFINLIKVGERSGTLDDVLSHLLEQQEKDYELISKTRNALIYPGIIILTAIAIVTLMMIFVIPNITAVLLEYKVELPLSTKVLVFLSDSIRNFGLVIALVLLVASILIRKWIKTEKGKEVWDALKLKIPFLKNIVIEFNIARFSRSMSTLMKSGVSIDEALQLTAEVCSNVIYRKSITSGIALIRKGVPLTQIMHGSSNIYPPMSIRMLEVGEKSGRIEHMFTRLAIFYEKSVLNTVTNLSSIIEPGLLIFIGVSVAFVAISVLTPIWKFAQTI
jgi:type IV pilus assembly protein PilC